MNGTATTRERIAEALRREPATASDLAGAFGIDRGSAIRHVRHVARSVEHTDESFLVRPPTCRACGFDGFDEPLNLPSRCPACKHERIAEPAFRIE